MAFADGLKVAADYKSQFPCTTIKHVYEMAEPCSLPFPAE